MKKARWVKQIEQWHKKNPSAMGLLTDDGAVKLLARQHAAMVRAVKNVSRFTFDTEKGMVDNDKSGAWVFLDDVLAALAKQGVKP